MTVLIGWHKFNGCMFGKLEWDFKIGNLILNRNNINNNIIDSSTHIIFVIYIIKLLYLRYLL